ncbi:MAG: DinB family protein [Actinomycetota bacterium]
MNTFWGPLIVGQLEFYWDQILRPRLDGLTDDEYLWEPVPGSWSIRKQPDGRYLPDMGYPEPDPPPLTTIAWRMMHIGAECLYNRANAFFGDGDAPGDATMFDRRFLPSSLPGTADEAIAFMDEAYRRWHTGITSLTEEQLRAPLGPMGAGFADDPMAGLVVHISREVMHHGGEIGALRDLYRAGAGARLA